MFITSRWSKMLGVVSLMGAVAGIGGCNNPKTADGASDVAVSEQAGQGRGEHGPRGMHPQGPAMLLGAALHELDLSDAQKTTIRGELEALRPDKEDKVDHETARKALAAAVRSGKVDQAAIVAQMPKPNVDKARLAKAINVLHDTLSAAQRKELADKMIARMDRMGGPDGKAWGGKDKGPRGEHERGERGERGEGFHGPMGHILHGLDLSDAQKDAVKKALEGLAPNEADRDAMKAQREAFQKTARERLTAFESDKFDATAFAAMPEGAAKHGPEAMAEHMVAMLAAVVPILNETQRAELAKRLEEGPMGAPRMGKGHGPAHEEQDDAE